jgi:two-component system, NtrC family, sensor histidine kinase PilS
MSFFNFNLSADLLNANLNQTLAPQGNPQLQSHAINILNIFRFSLSLIFVFTYLYIGKENWWDRDHAPLFFNLSLAYFLFSIFILLISPLKSAAHRLALPLQVIIDISFIILLMFAAGGIQSGLGLLLIITIVTASLVSNGRLALFYAAVASIGLLLEQSYHILKLDLSAASYTQPVMLSVSCFATAGLAYSLVRRMQHSEALASARGIDLENLEQVNALITQEMQDGVIVVDQDLNIRHYNSHAGSLLSLPNKNTENLSLAKNAPEIAAIFSSWVKGDDADNDANNNANNNAITSISNRELKLRFMPINQPQDSLNEDLHLKRNLGAVIFIQDWSQIQATAQQTKLAALGRLTANIAHEIRNPLSAISHANQLLQEEDVPGPTTRILQIIEDNIQRIDQIIKDVLELNRRDRTHQEQIDLSKFLADFYNQFCVVEKLATSDFQLDPCQQKQFVAFDQRHLTQILWNLCKNGWEHSRKQTKSLSLRCLAVGNTGLNIEIVDDGAGVAEQDRAKLFEPFYTTKSTGNGLGLYISRELAEANGASLQYQALSQGSAFIIHLKKVQVIKA